MVGFPRDLPGAPLGRGLPCRRQVARGGPIGRRTAVLRLGGVPRDRSTAKARPDVVVRLGRGQRPAAHEAHLHPRGHPGWYARHGPSRRVREPGGMRLPRDGLGAGPAVAREPCREADHARAVAEPSDVSGRECSEVSTWSQDGVGTNNEGDDRMTKHLAYTYDIYIGAPVSKVWKGIVDGDMTKHYVYGTRLDSKLKKGTPYAYVGEGEFKVVDGDILDIEPEKRLVMTWSA